MGGMPTATAATSSHHRKWARGGMELYHMRYRGFAAAAHAHEVPQAVIALEVGFQPPSHFAETCKVLRGSCLVLALQ